jgi:hypothetical protein
MDVASAPGRPVSPALTERLASLSPLVFAAAGAGYLAALLAVDHFSSFWQQVGLGALTWAVLIVVLVQLPLRLRALALGVVCFATLGEVTGAFLWGV